MSVVTAMLEGSIAWVVVDSPPVNATSQAVRSGLMEAVAKAQGQRLAVLSCTGRTFIAGGDMSEFDRQPEAPHLPDVVDAIEGSETPFLALLHGNVLGGGLEIAMACAFRIAAPGTRFGLPEVNVGLIPGAGGTQRAPRLFGWKAAIDMACSGRIIGDQEALRLGAIDAIERDLQAAARAHNAPRPDPVSMRAAAPCDEKWLAECRTAIESRAKGQTAPMDNFDALQWAILPYAEGQPKEREKHLMLRKSDQSRALRHAFFAERAAAKPAMAQGGEARDIQKVAIVGGGLMGTGIAASCLNAGFEATIVERDKVAAEAAKVRVAGLLEGALKRGKIDQPEHDRQLSTLRCDVRYSAAAGADIAIEAVFEDANLKRSVFRELAEIVPGDAILASNTSYLDPREIFDGVPQPERCLCLHFFSPAHIMKLVEIAALPDTSRDTLATGFGLASALRKIPVLSGICEGFVGNRMLAAYRRAAEYMLADGARPEEIDAAMRAFGMAMGPFEAQDMAGLQIAEANRRRQDAARDPAERYVEISDRLCALGRLGRRSGSGWYNYPGEFRKPENAPEVAALIEAYSNEKGISRKRFPPKEIQMHLLAALANEGARIVDEGIAESDAAIDVVQIHGYGFPRWRGGPMHTAGAIGKPAILAALDALESASPGSWAKADRYLPTGHLKAEARRRRTPHEQDHNMQRSDGSGHGSRSSAGRGGIHAGIL